MSDHRHYENPTKACYSEGTAPEGSQQKGRDTGPGHRKGRSKWKLPSLTTDIIHHHGQEHGSPLQHHHSHNFLRRHKAGGGDLTDAAPYSPTAASAGTSSFGAGTGVGDGGAGQGRTGQPLMTGGERPSSPSTTPSPASASPMSALSHAFSMKKRLSDSLSDSWTRKKSHQQNKASTTVPQTSSRLKESTLTTSTSSTTTTATSSSYPGNTSSGYGAWPTTPGNITPTTTTTPSTISLSIGRSRSSTSSSSITAAALTPPPAQSGAHPSSSHSSRSYPYQPPPPTPPTGPPSAHQTLTSSASIGTIASTSSSSSSSVYHTGGGAMSRHDSSHNYHHQYPAALSVGSVAAYGGSNDADSPTVPIYDGNNTVRRVSSRPTLASSTEFGKIEESLDEATDDYTEDEAPPRHHTQLSGLKHASVNLSRKVSDSRKILNGPLPPEGVRRPDSAGTESGGPGQSRRTPHTMLGLPPNASSRESTLSDSASGTTTHGAYDDDSDEESTASSLLSTTRSPSQPRSSHTGAFAQQHRGRRGSSSRLHHTPPHAAEYSRVPSEKSSLSSLDKARPHTATGHGPSRSMTASPARGLNSKHSANLRPQTGVPSAAAASSSSVSSASTTRVSSLGGHQTPTTSIMTTSSSALARSPTTRSDSTTSSITTTTESVTTSSSRPKTFAQSRTKRPSPPRAPVLPPLSSLPIPDPSAAPNVKRAPPSGMYWYKAPTHGANHEPLRAHSCTLMGSNIYVFGGCNTKSSFNTLQVFDADSMSWSQPQVKGDIPPPLRAMTTTAVRNKLVIFGGGDGPNYFNDVYVYDTLTQRYTKPPVGFAKREDHSLCCRDARHGAPRCSRGLLVPNIPVRRRAHTACLYKNGIYVFGGGDGEKALNDVWRLDVTDLKNPVWEEICPNLVPDPEGRDGAAPVEKRPKPRGYHTANMVGSKLIVYGGSDGDECFKDVWVFDVEDRKWTQVTIEKSYSRLSHTSTVIGSCLFVVGGHDGLAYSNEVLLLNLVTMQFDKRKVYGLQPTGRGYHCAVLYDSRLFIFGGFDGHNVFSETYILELAVSSYYSQISHFNVIVNQKDDDDEDRRRRRLAQ